MRVNATVKPNSKVELVENASDGLAVRVKAPAVDGKANEATVKLLAKYYSVSKTRVRIVRGATSRRKVIEISGL